MKEVEQESELFVEIFSDRVWGIIRTCDCGRTHYDVENDCDYDDGELEQLEEETETAPAGLYVPRSGSVGTLNIDGKTVIGCPCGRAKRYEDFIIDNQAGIAEYLNRRAEMLREEADSVEVKK